MVLACSAVDQAVCIRVFTPSKGRLIGKLAHAIGRSAIMA